MPKIKVTAKRDGFRRGGRAWASLPTTVDFGDFTKAQVEQLKAEDGKMITVEPAEDSEPKKTEPPSDPAPTPEPEAKADPEPKAEPASKKGKKAK